MSSYTCGCGDTVYLFGKDKGKQLARMMEIRFLGSIPIDPLFSEAADTGAAVVKLHRESLTAKAFLQIASNLAANLPPKEIPEALPEQESKPCSGYHNHHHHHHDHGHDEPRGEQSRHNGHRHHHMDGEHRHV